MMAELEALEKLRAWVRCVHGVERVNSTKTCANLDANAIEHANALFNDLEAEIASDYMRLPVDADGVPIHVGDRLYVDERELVANGITFYHNTWRVVTDFAAFDDGYLPRVDHQMRWAKDCRHVKPRTLEDVLRDVWNEALDYAKSDMWRNPDEVFAERADEIRELLGGDAK